MSRNRYTKTVRKAERAQIARQEKELAAIAKGLHNPHVEPEVSSAINENKAQRSVRLEQKRRHKPERFQVRIDQAA